MFAFNSFPIIYVLLPVLEFYHNSNILPLNRDSGTVEK